MRHFVRTALVAAALSFPIAANAAVIQSFGLDPTSAQGAFQHSLGTLTGNFSDQYTFSLDHAMTLTIASVTNVFAQPSDFITNFQGSVIAGTPALPGATVIGPVFAGACPSLPTSICQGFAGSALLSAGDYFLNISGFANGTSGYGGNLATFAAVPVPNVGTGLPGLIAGCLFFARWTKRRQAKKALRLAAA